MADRLARAFTDAPRDSRARRDVQYMAALIGHYVADAHVPFHAVTNYDGQLTGQAGIHARFEDDLVVRYRARLAIRPPALQPVASTRDFVFDTLLDSYDAADPVLQADRDASRGSRAYDHRYYQAFFSRAGDLLQQRIGTAISAVASVIASEWERAGRPPIPVSQGRPVARGRATP